jgi:hypothetical protein
VGLAAANRVHIGTSHALTDCDDLCYYPLLLVQVACASILFRQTNAVWVAFFIGVNVIQQLESMQTIKYVQITCPTRHGLLPYSSIMHTAAAMTRPSAR